MIIALLGERHEQFCRRRVIAALNGLESVGARIRVTKEGNEQRHASAKRSDRFIIDFLLC